MLEEQHHKILTMIRAGALDQAEKAIDRIFSSKTEFNEDIIVLPGRLKKSRAFEATGKMREALALEAATLYENAFQQTGGFYSGINTAAMYLVAGNRSMAVSVAAITIEKIKEADLTPGENAYFALATEAEAHLIMGEIEKAKSGLRDAIELDPHNYFAHAATIRQFEMLLKTIKSDVSWLAPMKPPKILHYSGHMFTNSKNMNSTIYAVERTVDDFLESHHVGAAYGALAAGSDILIAENLIDAGVELHIVLPGPLELFKEKSLLPFGRRWIKRFETCLGMAESVRFVSEDLSVFDELNVSLAGEVAMGLAALKAEEYATDALQLLVWDGIVGYKNYGTARDAKIWQNTAREQHIVHFSPPEFRLKAMEMLAKTNKDRCLQAMIFADVKGFGDLNESQASIFIHKVLKPLSQITEVNKEKITHLNTWGDGLFVALESVTDAAEISLKLQHCFNSIDLEKHDLPNNLALRIGAHYGVVQKAIDPFLNKEGIFGSQISIAARIEPEAAPGSIYVSEAFACALAITGNPTLHCEYIKDLNKQAYPTDLKLFLLRRKGEFILPNTVV